MGTVVMKQPVAGARDRLVAAILALVVPSIALADEAVVSVQVPPGGTSQFRVVVPPVVPNEPTPIIIDQVGPDFGVVGVAQLGAPEAAGTALTDGDSVIIRTVSPATAGPSFDPMIAVTVAVSDQAIEVATVNLSLPASGLDPSSSSLPNIVNEVDSIVNGTVSISEVLPGGGLLPAGSLVAVVGNGFQPEAQVLIDGVSPASTSWVDSSHIEVVTAVETQLDGKLVSVMNPDLTGAARFSFLHTTDLGMSARPLLAATAAIFPLQTRSSAVFAAPANGTFFALALQNPGPVDSTVSIELFDGGSVVAFTSLTLPPLTRVSREISELLPGVIPGPGSVFALLATVPVQMLGLSGNENDVSVIPVLPAPPAP
jgi:hypothetical protein